MYLHPAPLTFAEYNTKIIQQQSFRGSPISVKQFIGALEIAIHQLSATFSGYNASVSPTICLQVA